ncbi:MAG: methyltransferase domain-containing protein [Candidatus Omnitrophica bacterium]|nr:methyltransferase domain-containing protein [Candidatus Omnitrophota bacterium]
MRNDVIEQELLDILECPLCAKALVADKNELICVNDECRHRFSIIDGIPIMMPEYLKDDLRISQEKWDEEYTTYHQLQQIDLASDLELKDTLIEIKKSIKDRKGFFLEAGCGPSKVSCSMSKEGTRTVGLDFSLKALRISKALFEREGVKGHFVCGDISKMPFKKNTFSFIYTGGVIEHFKDTQFAVDELWRCLKSEGITWNTVPYLSLSVIYRVLLWGNIPDIPLIKQVVEFIEITLLKKKFMRFGYEKSFTQMKMEKIFRKSGFTMVNIGFFKTYYPLAWVKSVFLKNLLTKIADTRLFWPMIYILAKK